MRILRRPGRASAARQKRDRQKRDQEREGARAPFFPKKNEGAGGCRREQTDNKDNKKETIHFIHRSILTTYTQK